MQNLSPILLTALGLGLGGAGGFAFYRFVGCRTNTCPLVSTWWTATLFGAFLGWSMVNR